MPEPEPIRPRSALPPAASRVPWWSHGILPLSLLVGSLFAVGAVLLVTSYITRAARDQIVQVADPAAAGLYELQRIVAQEMSAQRGLQLGGEAGAAREYAELKREERAAFEALRPLVHALGPDASERFAELKARTERWEAEVEAAQLEPDPSRVALVEELSTASGLYASVLVASDSLEAAIQHAAETRRRRVQKVERLQVELVALFVALALGSTLLLVRVGHRMNQLADRSHALASAAQERQLEMERLTEEKARFIRGITHDLKNPLGAVDAYAQLLEAGIKGGMTPEQLHVVSRIRRATHDALGTIQDLLELARAEAGQLRIERRSTDPAKLVTEAVEDYRAALEGAGLRVEVRAGDDLPLVQTDASRVREVMGNLLSNALKYTPSGGAVRVEVRTARAAPLESRPALEIRVRDTGPGIAPEEQAHIFDEFHRVAGSGAAGMGLGLAISRRIARLLGGELTVESTPGEGASFSLWLPAAPLPVGSTES